MTVAIGLICSDGVLVASDSMASEKTGLARHAIKVFKFDTLPVVWTASGSLFVIEEVQASLSELEETSVQDKQAKGRFTDPSIEGIRRNVGTCLKKAVGSCYAAALPGGDRLMRPDGSHFFATDFMILGYANSTPYLLEFAKDGQMNWHTNDHFYAVGSGGPFASVALALMEHYLEEGPLPLELGKRLAYRTIETTCRVSSSFVGLPVQMAVVDASGAKIIDADEISEIGDAVEGWKIVERDSLKGNVSDEPTGALEGIAEVPDRKADGTESE